MRYVPLPKSWTVCRRPQRSRLGAIIVEMALIGPMLFLMLIGLTVLGLGTFRYNQVTALAHEGARWAAVHGKNFDRLNHRSTAVTSSDLYNEVIVPRAMGLDLHRLTCELTWGLDRRIVSVTVNYRWGAEAYFGEKIMSSTSTVLTSN